MYMILSFSVDACTCKFLLLSSLPKGLFQLATQKTVLSDSYQWVWASAVLYMLYVTAC